MNNYIIIILFLLICSCKKETSSTISQQEISKESSNAQKGNLILKKCSEFTGDWAEIIAFEDELKRVLTTETQMDKDLELLKKLLEDFKKTYPKRFKTLTIEARVKVLETEILMLEQDLKDYNYSQITTKKGRIQNAYNVFVSQIEAQIYKERDYEKYK
ncbi:MAG: hypothetical protein ACPGU9_05635 [Flavobacteriaceae bacterium]